MKPFERLRLKRKIRKGQHLSVADQMKLLEVDSSRELFRLYMQKEGCTWRGIPHDYPKWQNVRYHYDIWKEPDENGISLLDRILRKLVEMERKENNRCEKTTMIIVDSKSIKNADTAEIKGYDAGKKFPE